jgi:ArsR family transcriptional regulator
MHTEDAAVCLDALGNATRLAIFRLLVRAGEPGLPVGAIQQALGIAGSTLSHHLRALLVVGLVTRRRQGTVLTCRADFALMQGLVDFLVAECCTGVPGQGDVADARPGADEG